MIFNSILLPNSHVWNDCYNSWEESDGLWLWTFSMNSLSHPIRHHVPAGAVLLELWTFITRSDFQVNLNMQEKYMWRLQ